jgi:vacuolar-type H+-ATPase subunit H
MTKGMKSLIALISWPIHNKLVKLFVLSLIFFNFSYADEVSDFFLKYWKLTPKAIKSIKNKEIISDAEVETKGDEQYFIMQGAALHNKSCTTAFRKLSRLENYHEYIEFIKKSEYKEKKSIICGES